MNMRTETIDNVVRDICAFMGDKDASEKYTIVARAVKRAVEQLQIYLWPNVKTEWFTIDANLTIDLGKNIEYPIKVGAEVNKRFVQIPYDGSLFDFNVNAMPGQSFEACQCSKDLISTSDDESKGTCVFCDFYDYTHSGHLYGEYYGLSVSNRERGAWKYDPATNIIILDSGVCVSTGARLLVQYKPAIQKSMYKSIPVKYFPIIMQRVNQWLNQGSNVSAASFAKEEFLAEYDQLKDNETEFTLEDLVDAIQSGYAYTVKR